MNRTIVFLMGCLLMQNIVFSQTPTYVPIDPHWQLQWQDEFDTFDNSRWGKGNYGVGSNLGVVIYMNEQVWVSNGNLVIEVNNNPIICPPGIGWTACMPCVAGKTYNYRSGLVSTFSTYNTQYGYIEARIKLPYVKDWGFWPAFWTTIGWKVNSSHNAAEIDIFEMYGGREEPNIIHTNIHKEYPDGNPYGAIVTMPNFSYADWHKYAVEWNADRIIWYVDGKAIRTLSNHSIVDQVSIILNLAIQSQSKYYPPTSPPWSEQMLVDYVRVYSLKCEENPDMKVVNEIANFNTYNYAVKKSITMSNATTIPANSNITLRATDFIELKPGFSIDTGRELYLDVTSCPGTPILKPPPQRE